MKKPTLHDVQTGDGIVAIFHAGRNRVALGEGYEIRVRMLGKKSDEELYRIQQYINYVEQWGYGPEMFNRDYYLKGCEYVKGTVIEDVHLDQQFGYISFQKGRIWADYTTKKEFIDNEWVEHDGEWYVSERVYKKVERIKEESLRIKERNKQRSFYYEH